MGLSYRIDGARRLVRLLYEGETTYAEWRDVMLVMMAEADFAHCTHVLADRRLASTASADFVRAVVGFLGDHAAAFTDCRWATLVASPAAYGMSRMAQTLASDLPFPLRVFTDEADAFRWLAGSDAD